MWPHAELYIPLGFHGPSPLGTTSGDLATQKLGQGFQGWSMGRFLQCANDWQLSQVGIQALWGV